MGETNKIHAFIKIGQKSHLEKLINEGEIYLNPLSYFKRLTVDQNRMDSNEGINSLKQLESITIRIDDKNHFFSKKNKTNKLVNAQLREWREDNGNIYSLLALTSSLIENNEKLDDRLLSFADADSCVIILSPKIFIEKIITEIKHLDVNCEYGMVKYYDPNSYHGELGIFYKEIKFAYQNEYRFYIEKDHIGAMKIHIGSIKDFSILLPISQLNSLRFSLISK